MALNNRSLVLAISVPHTADAAPTNFYKYASPDAAATIVAAGYFNNVRDKLKVGDIIEAVALAGGATADRLDLVVTAVPATGNVTVAVNGEAAGT
jgi:hypothetical protein